MPARPSRRGVLSALGAAGAATVLPRASEGQQLRPLFETLERLEREVDQQIDLMMDAPYESPAYALADRALKRLQAQRDRAFEAVAAAPASSRDDIERKFAIVYDWMRASIDGGEPFVTMLDSVRRDFQALR